MTDHSPHEGYDGPAELLVRDRTEPTGPLTVDVTLRGHFQPIDGRYHWHGRVAADARVDALAADGTGAVAVLTTPQGSAEGRLSDVDPWGRYRIAGAGRPPFRVET